MGTRTRIVVIGSTVVVCAVVAVSVVLADSNSSHASRASAGATTTSMDHAHTHHGTAATSEGPTATQRAAAARLVTDTKSAIAKYADEQVARAAGYRPNPRGGPKATHHPKRALMRDDKVLDPSAPESLMYWTAPDGRKVLVGAVYKTRADQDAPTPGGALTMWHTHAGTGTMCHPAMDPDCPQHTAKMLHVFVFDGVQDPFAENMRAAAGGRAAFREAMQQALASGQPVR